MWNLVCVCKSLSCVQLFVTPWALQSMEFSRPEYWSGWPFPSPGDLSNSGIKPRSPALQADSLPSESQWNLEYHTNELLQNRNRLTDTENRLEVANREGSAGGMDWEFGISRGKLKCINNKVLLCSTGNYSQNPVINQNGNEYDKNV